MARVKGAMMTRKRRNKVLKLAKGYYGSKSRLFKTAKQAVMKSGQYAYIGRKQRKRDFRRLWITRISAGAQANGQAFGPGQKVFAVSPTGSAPRGSTITLFYGGF